MITAILGSWVSWGVYSYVVGPAIDKTIPESKSGVVQVVKAINQFYTAVNKLCFMTPILTVQAVVENIKTKVAE